MSNRNAKELIKASMYELVSRKGIEQVTVREIVNHCGVTTRAFYNHYTDKHDAISQIYLAEMKPYLMSSITEWSDRRSELFMGSPEFFHNCISYTGQNNLMETIIQLDREKYAMHIRTDLSPTMYRMVMQGIVFLISGNVGLLREAYGNRLVISEAEYEDNYQSAGQFMRVWWPEIVKENLTDLPERPPTKTLLCMLENV